MRDGILRAVRPLVAGPVAGLVWRRLGAGLATLLVVSVVIFVATEVLPGDAATAILGRNASPELVAQVREQLELDKPAVERYLDWLTGALRGDLEESIGAGVPVTELIGERIVNSLILAMVAAAILIPLSVLLGTLAGARPGSVGDHLINQPALIAISLPEFVAGTVLILIFATWLGLLPGVSLVPPGTSPLSEPQRLILPVLTLLAGSLAQTTRMVRAGVLEVRQTAYVEMARLKGVPENIVLRRHVLPNALVPSVQVIALNLQWLVGGIVVTEVIFAYPGIGQSLVQAVAGRDVPVIQAASLFIAAVYIALNIVADILVVVLTPKLRTR